MRDYSALAIVETSVRPTDGTGPMVGGGYVWDHNETVLDVRYLQRFELARSPRRL